MRIDFSVPEQSLSSLKLGRPVKVGPNMDALKYNGTIVGIDPKIDPASRLVSVRAEVQNDEPRLTPGQFVQVRVELPQEDNILALPQTTIVTSLYGDYVYAVRPEQPKEGEKAPEGQAAKQVAQQVFVKVGRRYGGVAEITDGLKAGDIVITAGQNRLSPGAAVTIDNTVNPLPAADK
mgnify:FL=1